MAMIGGSNEAGPGGGVSAAAQGYGGDGGSGGYVQGLTGSTYADALNAQAGTLALGGQEVGGVGRGFSLGDFLTNPKQAAGSIGQYLGNIGKGFDFSAMANTAMIFGPNPLGLFAGVMAGLLSPDRDDYGERLDAPDYEFGFEKDEDGRGKEYYGEVDKIAQDSSGGITGSIYPGPTAESARRREEERGSAGLGLSGDLESTTKKYFKGTGSNLLSQGLVFDENEFTKKLF